MLVLNAGLEVIKFGYNACTRNPKEGGFYKVKVGEQIDIPDGAIDLVKDPHSGPGLKGLVILEFGSNIDELKVKGLEAYIKSVEFALNMENERTFELEQVGRKYNFEREPVKRFRLKLENAQKVLEDLVNPKPVKAKEIEEEKQDGDSDSNHRLPRRASKPKVRRQKQRSVQPGSDIRLPE